jgi:hypothetical protein
MIDTLNSLAFSMQANPGVYALLLGSGVSRSAKIPTGWEITLDLVSKLAAAQGEEDVRSLDPENWYREKFGKDPDYSDLLDELAKTPAERQQLIRGYLEPTEEERADGLKAPTPAHKAIAKLVAQGYVRVVITTNFDRLMEKALEAEGVVPTVISTKDQVNGAMPLIHQRCCVFKVHGDYFDTRIRNTEAELKAYPKAFNQLLDRILDEFGLIVCGWSATWDPALRQAIERSKSRRFSHYWAMRGEPTEEAQKLIEYRQGLRVNISDADSFFSKLVAQVEAISEVSRQNPVSVKLKVAALKKYLVDPVNRIRLDDLISDEVSHILEVTSGSKFSFKECLSLDKESFTRRVRAYDAVCEGLIAMAAVGGRWVEEWHYPIWRKALTRLGSVSEVGCGHSGNGVWHGLKRYPATLLLYSLGISALPTGDRGVSLLSLLLSTELQGEGQGDTKAVEVLPPIFLFRGQQTELSGLLDGMEGRELPINEWLLRLLPPFFGDYFVSEDKFQYWFDRLEVLIAINFLSSNLDGRMGGALPFGLFAWQDVFFPLKRLSPHTQEIDDVLAADGEKSVYVAGGFLGRSVNEVCDSLKKLKDRVEDTSRF